MDGVAVRRVRARLGLTQVEFGRRVGVHAVTVSRWERDEVPVRDQVAILIRLLDRPAPRARRRTRRTRREG